MISFGLWHEPHLLPFYLPLCMCPLPSSPVMYSAKPLFRVPQYILLIVPKNPACVHCMQPLNSQDIRTASVPRVSGLPTLQDLYMVHLFVGYFLFFADGKLLTVSFDTQLYTDFHSGSSKKGTEERHKYKL